MQLDYSKMSHCKDIDVKEIYGTDSNGREVDRTSDRVNRELSGVDIRRMNTIT